MSYTVSFDASIKCNVLQEYTDSTKPKMSQADINMSIRDLEDRLKSHSANNDYSYSR